MLEINSLRTFMYDKVTDEKLLQNVTRFQRRINYQKFINISIYLKFGNLNMTVYFI